jgi:5-exo-hydroxycamphor dehydrogenase
VILPQAKAEVEIRSFSVNPPAEGHITVKLELAGICGTDPHLWKGDFQLPGPIILGHEGIGTVHALHESVKTDHTSQPLDVGDRVYWTGVRPCYACYCCTIEDDECGCPNNFFMHQFDEAANANGT